MANEILAVLSIQWPLLHPFVLPGIDYQESGQELQALPVNPSSFRRFEFDKADKVGLDPHILKC